MIEGRRTFGPVVAVGLGAGVLAAVASARPWVVDRSLAAGTDPLGQVAEAGEMPLAGALALVVLACWGVVLVTRHPVRRAVLVLGVVVAVGLLVTVVVSLFTLPEQVQEAFPTGATRTTDASSIGTTGWFWTAAVATIASVATTGFGVVWSPDWPEMGSRYDAPGASRDRVPAEDQSNLDLWKSMDEGRDPTA